METIQLKKVHDLLNEALELVNKNINKDKISTIERDLVLEKLRNAYDLLVLDHRVEKQTVVPTVVHQATKVNVEKQHEVPTKPISPEIKPQFSKELKKEPLPKKVEKPEVHERTIKHEPVKEDSKGSISAIRDKQPSEILADKFQGTRKFRNEALSHQVSKTDISTKQQNKPILDLVKAIGINDKFLYMKELFNGDVELYNTTLNKLNKYTDITDAMIYLHENFSWKSDNEAASKFIELLRRKLLNE